MHVFDGKKLNCIFLCPYFRVLPTPFNHNHCGIVRWRADEPLEIPSDSISPFHSWAKSSLRLERYAILYRPHPVRWHPLPITFVKFGSLGKQSRDRRDTPIGILSQCLWQKIPHLSQSKMRNQKRTALLGKNRRLVWFQLNAPIRTRCAAKSDAIGAAASAGRVGASGDAGICFSGSGTCLGRLSRE